MLGFYLVSRDWQDTTRNDGVCFYGIATAYLLGHEYFAADLKSIYSNIGQGCDSEATLNMYHKTGVDFIRVYADRTHHRKEWNILLRELNKVGLHFTQLTTRCSMGPWNSQDTLLPASIILQHSKSLMNDLAAMMPAGIISPNFDGRKVFVVRTVETLPRNYLGQDVVSLFVENVNDKLPFLLKRFFIRRTSHFGRGFLPCGLGQGKSMEPALLAYKEYLDLAFTILPGLGFINCVVRWYVVVGTNGPEQLKLMKLMSEA